MDDQWTIPTDSNPHKDPQGHHAVQAYARYFSKGSFQSLVLQVPPTAASTDPNFQPNTPTPAQGTYDTVPNCSYQRCSDTQHRQPTRYPIEQQDPQHFSDAVTPYANRDQGVNNHVETALIAPVRSQAQFAPPQAAEIQDNFGYLPVPERAGPFDMGLVPSSNTQRVYCGGSQASSGPLHQQPRCIRQRDTPGARPVWSIPSDHRA
ncbi:hypothetical protein EDB84DRAFT_660639 [Lactarius hengduanensis]|nr:hypothetical protein EDB84DRAFT_660639 [Lactarius hengduanensis]